VPAQLIGTVIIIVLIAEGLCRLFAKFSLIGFVISQVREAFTDTDKQEEVRETPLQDLVRQRRQEVDHARKELEAAKRAATELRELEVEERALREAMERLSEAEQQLAQETDEGSV